jgi:hypothetical protein
MTYNGLHMDGVQTSGLLQDIILAKIVRTSDNSRPSTVCNKGRGNVWDHNDRTDNYSPAVYAMQLKTAIFQHPLSRLEGSGS